MSCPHPPAAHFHPDVQRWVPDIAERDVYLCASPGLSAAVRTALHDSGLPRQRLHEENFSF